MNKKEYIEAIVQMLEETKDIQLVDYIYKLLRKTS